jgi:hypothetical protein
MSNPLLALLATHVGALLPSTPMLGPRPPYVKDAENVNYIGRFPVPGGFSGSQVVYAVMEWDGTGYPCLMNGQSYRWRDWARPGSLPKFEVYYDHDLVNMDKELPKDFWSSGSHDNFPNVHTWLRMKRFGETMEQAIRHLNFSSTDEFLERLKDRAKATVE